MASLQQSSFLADQERTEAHEEIEAMKRKKEAEKAEEREGTVMVRGGRGREPSQLLISSQCCVRFGCGYDIHCPLF